MDAVGIIIIITAIQIWFALEIYIVRNLAGLVKHFIGYVMDEMEKPEKK
jgi:hypothetical protein